MIIDVVENVDEYDKYFFNLIRDNITETNLNRIRFELELIQECLDDSNKKHRYTFVFENNCIKIFRSVFADGSNKITFDENDVKAVIK